MKIWINVFVFSHLSSSINICSSLEQFCDDVQMSLLGAQVQGIQAILWDRKRIGERKEKMERGKERWRESEKDREEG